MGLVPAVALGSGGLLSESEPAARVAFTLTYATPYLLALLASRSRNPGVRGGLLAAIALLSLAASFSSFSLVTVVFLLATFVLGFSAAESLSASSRPLVTSVPAAAVGLFIAAIVGLGFFALFGVQDDEGRCWVSYGGSEGWVDEDSGKSGARVVGRRCTSDIFTNVEAAMGTGAVVVALLGMLFVLRLRWPADDPAVRPGPGSSPPAPPG